MKKELTEIPTPLHDKLSDDDISRHYLRNTMLNIYYRVFQPLLRQTTIKSPQQAWKNLPSLEKEIASVVDTEIQKRGDFEKIRTSLALTEDFPGNYLSYLERYYDLQVYMALIRAKYALLQAGVNTGNARAVRAFLEHNEPATLNPFTQEPFEWDEAQHLLSAPWISTQTPSAYKPGDTTPQTHMSVYIP